jgi:hypothetical protein
MKPEDDILTEEFLNSLQSESTWLLIAAWKSVLEPLKTLTEIVSQESTVVMSSLPRLLHSAVNALPADQFVIAKKLQEALGARFRPWLDEANLGMCAMSPCTSTTNSFKIFTATAAALLDPRYSDIHKFLKKEVVDASWELLKQDVEFLCSETRTRFASSMKIEYFYESGTP